MRICSRSWFPPWATVRGLMQFNQYHKYTVDEHSLLAVARAEALSQDQGVLGEVYRSIKRKDLLHLAVLLHDLGKGRRKTIVTSGSAWRKMPRPVWDSTSRIPGRSSFSCIGTC